MISSINSLTLKPIKPYTGKGPSDTTITSFDEMLEKQKKGYKLAISSEEIANGTALTGADAAKRAEKKSSSENGNLNQSAQELTDASYRNQATGASVRYVDVADKSDEGGKPAQTESTSSVSTTSADSMKKTKYDEYFKKAAAKYNVSESLLKGIAKAESNFNAKAVSSAGAMGVMQLMPTTASSLGVKNPYDPEQNIMGGAKCISQKLKEFNGDVRLALAAYNAGSGAVKRYGGVPSYCNSYVKKVLSYKEAFETASAVA